MAELTAKEKKALTERQQQIHGMQKDGKTAPQIAAELKISDNAVYQNLRAIRAALGGKTPAKRTGAAKSGRKSTGKRTAAKAKATPKPAAAAPAASKPVAAPKPPTMLQLAKQELKGIDDQIREQEQEIVAAQRAEAQAKERIVKLNEDRGRKADVLAVLQGEKRAVAIPKPKPSEAATPPADAAGGPDSRVERQNAAKRSSGAKASGTKASGSNGSGKAASGAQAATPASAPSRPTTQAEREATAEHDGTAPAPDPIPA